MNAPSPVIESTLLRGRVKLLQPKTGFHASVDTVFLAAALIAKEKGHIIDIGCGVGSAGFCALARIPGLHLTGIDVQPELVDLAHQNAALNGWSERCRFFNGNILTDKQVPDNAFHAALMNPPYQEAGTHTPSPLKNKAISHGEEASGASLEGWTKYAHRKLKQGGSLALIHRADRLDDVILALTQRRWFGSLTVLPLHSRAGDDAKRVIVTARKERYAPLVLKTGLVLHEQDGKYTDAAEAVLSRGETCGLAL
jgi:tRNA1(Val) A37 N6-methylase TrmN6